MSLIILKGTGWNAYHDAADPQYKVPVANIPVELSTTNGIEVGDDGLFVPTSKLIPTGGSEGDRLVKGATGPEWQPTAPCTVPIRRLTQNLMLTLEDQGKLLIADGKQIMILPTSSSWPIGYRVDIQGPTNIVPSAGITLDSVDDMKRVAAKAGATLIKTGTDQWWLAGALKNA